MINSYTTTSIITGFGAHLKQLAGFGFHILLFSFLCVCGGDLTKEDKNEERSGVKEPLKFTTYI